MLIGVIADQHRRHILRHKACGKLRCAHVVFAQLIGVFKLFRLFGHEARPFSIKFNQILCDDLTLRRVGRKQGFWAALGQYRAELPTQVKGILHGDVHALSCFGAVGVAGITANKHMRHDVVFITDIDVIEFIGNAVSHLIDRPPRHLFDI